MLAPGTWLQLDLKLCEQRSQQSSSNKRKGEAGVGRKLHIDVKHDYWAHNTRDDIAVKHVYWALTYMMIKK